MGGACVLIHGETVLVSFREFGEPDALGNLVETYTEPAEVSDVLIGKGSTYNRAEEGRLYAVEADKSFCFPRDWDADLRGAHITYDGITYQVVGIPSRITDANIPSGIRWNIKVNAEVWDG